MKRALIGLMVLILIFIGWVWVTGTREEYVAGQAEPESDSLRLRGEHLVRAADCQGCHTKSERLPFAGGRLIRTPFGDLLTPNITSDQTTGIGDWTSDDFWRALHNGRGRDGRLLYPAFPFPNYTKVTRDDADAMFAYLKATAPVRQVVLPTKLRFPFDQRLLLIAWRALYFRPGVYQADLRQSPAWNRGAYLVTGLGHCDACHADRNLFGATESGRGLSGAQMPVMNWYAPSLANNSEVGLLDWPAGDLVTLLRTGVSSRSAVFGPMAEVVQRSTQYLNADDLMAVANFLGTAQNSGVTQPPNVERANKTFPVGAKIYDKFCAECHQDDGQGVPGIYPPLAGNRAVTMDSPVNSIRIVSAGGFAPVTHDNPRPYGMPPFDQTLNDQQIAEVVNYVRNSWGNRTDEVLAHEVDRYRNAPLE